MHPSCVVIHVRPIEIQVTGTKLICKSLHGPKLHAASNAVVETQVIAVETQALFLSKYKLNLTCYSTILTWISTFQHETFTGPKKPPYKSPLIAGRAPARDLPGLRQGICKTRFDHYHSARSLVLCLGHISQKGPSRTVSRLFLAVFWMYRTGPGGTPTGCRPFFSPRAGPGLLLLLT